MLSTKLIWDQSIYPYLNNRELYTKLIEHIDLDRMSAKERSQILTIKKML